MYNGVSSNWDDYVHELTKGILAIFWLSEPHQIKYICNDIHVRCPNTRCTFLFIWYQILSYIKWCCLSKLIQCKCIYFTCLN